MLKLLKMENFETKNMSTSEINEKSSKVKKISSFKAIKLQSIPTIVLDKYS